jgi:hypothetical protein
MIDQPRNQVREQLDGRDGQAEQDDRRLLRRRCALRFAAHLAELAMNAHELAVDPLQAAADFDAEARRLDPIIRRLTRDLVGGAVGLPRHLLRGARPLSTDGHLDELP